MRQIKFRAWDTNTEVMITEPEFIQVYGNGDFEVFIESQPEWIGGTDGAILMQFSGIQDTNKKDVYEGDILLDLFSKMVYEVKFGQIPKLGFTGWYAYSKERVTTLNGDYDSPINGAIEIIGNIYENLDLMPQGGNPELSVATADAQ